MATYRIETRTFTLNDADIAALLATIHARRDRPLCLCQRNGVPMYVAKAGARFIIKRMPNSGGQHQPNCESYEPPAELSGLGELTGAAIQENVDEGVTTLRFGFGLSKLPGRTPPAPSGAESDTVKSDGKKLTLRGTLHYLWDQAGFHRWTPAMRGKRSWAVIRKYLSQAAQDKRAKGTGLDDILYLPEPFRLDDKEAIEQRRALKLAPLSAGTSGARKLMILIGEVKEFRQARFGFKAVIRHLADYTFMLDEKLFKQLEKRFQTELLLWDSKEDSHLIMVATFGVNPAGAYIEETALMVVNDQWVPFESNSEHRLLQALTEQNRPFIKGLRFNLDSKQPLAAAVVSDCTPKPVALYVIPPTASDKYTAALDEMVRESSMPAWFWRPAGEGLPKLPEREGYTPAGMPSIAAVVDHPDDDDLHALDDAEDEIHADADEDGDEG